MANDSSKKPFAGKFRRTDVTLGFVGAFLFTDINRLVGFLGTLFLKKVEKNPFIICSFDRKFLPLQSINNPYYN